MHARGFHHRRRCRRGRSRSGRLSPWCRPCRSEITSALPAASPKNAVARPPPAGPLSSRRIGKARAVSGDTRPPAECMRCSSPRKPRCRSSRSSARRSGPSAAARRRWRRWWRSAGIPTARPPRRRRATPRCRGTAARIDCAGGALVRGIAIGVQEADGDRLDAFGDQALRARRADLGGIERRERRCRRGPCARRLPGGGGAAPAGRGIAGTGRRCRSAARCPSRGCRGSRAW